MITVKCRRLIYDVDEEPIDEAAVVVTGDRIEWVGPAQDAPSRDGEDVVDLGSQFVLPGLVDSHAHISANMALRGTLEEQHEVDLVTASLRGVANLSEDLASGVTTMRTLGGPDKLEARFRDAIRAGVIKGPRLQIAIRMLRPTHGTANFVEITADGTDELRHRIRETFYFGADWLKIFATNVMHGETMEDYLRGDLTGVPGYSRDEISFAVDEAHAIGMKVAAHAIGGPAVRWAIEAGVDSIEHGDLIDEADVDLFVKHGDLPV